MKMAATGSRIRQNRTGTRARPLPGRDGSNEEHSQNLIGTLAVVKGNMKKATIACKAESQLFSRTDQEGEVGRSDSQQFLELVKYGSKYDESIKKASKHLEEFKKAVDTQGKNLRREIDRQKAQSSSRDAEDFDHFDTAYLPILRDNAVTQMQKEQLNPDPSRSLSSLYQESSNVFKNAAALVEQLQKSCIELGIHQTSSTVDTDWQEDIERMQRILDSGRQIGEQKIESIFTGIRNPILDAQTAEISQLLYDKHSRLAGELTWDQAVRKQEKAVMRLVSTLPWQ